MNLFSWTIIGIILLAVFIIGFGGKSIFSEAFQNTKTIVGDTKASFNKLKDATGTKKAEDSREVNNK